MLNFSPRRLSDFPSRFFSFCPFFLSFALTQWEDSPKIQRAYKRLVSSISACVGKNKPVPSRVTTHSCAPIVSRSHFYQLLSQQSTWCVFLHSRAPDALMDAAQSRHDVWRLLGPQSERSPQDSGQCGIKPSSTFSSFFSYLFTKVLRVLAFVAGAFARDFPHEPLCARSQSGNERVSGQANGVVNIGGDSPGLLLRTAAALPPRWSRK